MLSALLRCFSCSLKPVVIQEVHVTWLNAGTCMCMHVSMNVCVSLYVNLWTCMHVYTSMHSCASLLACVYLCVCCMHACVHAYIGIICMRKKHVAITFPHSQISTSVQEVREAMRILKSENGFEGDRRVQSLSEQALPTSCPGGSCGQF